MFNEVLTLCTGFMAGKSRSAKLQDNRYIDFLIQGILPLRSYYILQKVFRGVFSHFLRDHTAVINFGGHGANPW